MATEPNPYLCLGLMPGSTPVEIKRRYRQLAKQYHPDRCGSADGSEEKLRVLNAAYAVLSDPKRRAAYDSRPGTLFSAASVPQPVPRYSPRRKAALAVMAALTLLLSTDLGRLYHSAAPLLTYFYAQISDTETASRPAPTYSFLPLHSTFNDRN